MARHDTEFGDRVSGKLPLCSTHVHFDESLQKCKQTYTSTYIHKCMHTCIHMCMSRRLIMSRQLTGRIPNHGTAPW